MGGAYELTNDGVVFWDGDGIEACNECGRVADNLCDFPVGNGKTCDMLLCDDHSHPIAEDRHLCPIHAAIFTATGTLEPIKMKRINIVS